MNNKKHRNKMKSLCTKCFIHHCHSNLIVLLRLFHFSVLCCVVLFFIWNPNDHNWILPFNISFNYSSWQRMSRVFFIFFSFHNIISDLLFFVFILFLCIAQTIFDFLNLLFCFVVSGFFFIFLWNKYSWERSNYSNKWIERTKDILLQIYFGFSNRIATE